VAAITSKIDKARLPTHIEIQADEYGLTKDSVVLAEQVRTIDKRRLRERVGVLSTEAMAAVDEALQISMGVTEL
jgi:mRNA interferase MazF